MGFGWHPIILWKKKKCCKPPTRKLFKTKPTFWHFAVPTSSLDVAPPLHLGRSDQRPHRWARLGSAHQRHDVHWGRNHGAMRLKKRQEMFVLILDAVCLHSHWNQAPALGYVHQPKDVAISKTCQLFQGGKKRSSPPLKFPRVAPFFLVPSALSVSEENNSINSILHTDWWHLEVKSLGWVWDVWRLKDGDRMPKQQLPGNMMGIFDSPHNSPQCHGYLDFWISCGKTTLKFTLKFTRNACKPSTYGWFKISALLTICESLTFRGFWSQWVGYSIPSSQSLFVFDYYIHHPLGLSISYYIHLHQWYWYIPIISLI